MEVRLEPVGPTGRQARLGAKLAVLVPVVALAVVVVAAGAPNLPGADIPPDGRDAAASQARPSASGVAPSLTEPTAATVGPVARDAPSYAWDLPVRSLWSVLEDRAAGVVRGGLVAVEGLLSYDPRTARCPDSDPGLAIELCHRTAVLSGSSGSSTEPGAEGATVDGPADLPSAAAEPRLYPWIPAGIPMPSMFSAEPPPGAPGEALPSIVIGRFARQRPPVCAEPRCLDVFVVERLAWAAGSWVDRIVVWDPGLPGPAALSTGRRLQAIGSREADRMEQILSLAILQPRWLEGLDPAIGAAAADGAAAAGLAAGPVWYLRSVGRRFASDDRSLTWAVIDHQTGLVLASGAIDPG
jgi:hypothetical protein